MCVNAVYVCMYADDEKLMILKYKKSVNKMLSTTTTTMDNTTYIHTKMTQIYTMPYSGT